MREGRAQSIPGGERLGVRWPMVLGLALLHAWIYTPFQSADLFYLCFHGGFAACLVGCAVLYGLRPQGTPLRRVAPWLAAALMGAGAATVFLDGVGQAPAVLVGCAALSGAGSAYVFARWFQAYCAGSLRTAAADTLLAFSLSAVLRLGVVLFGGLWDALALAVLLVLPFASTGLLTWIERGGGAGSVAEKPAACAPASQVGSGGPGLAAEEQAGAERAAAGSVGAELASGPVRPGAAGLRSLLPALGGFAAYGLVFGVLRNGINEYSVSEPSMVANYALRIAVPLLLFWWLASADSSGDRESRDRTLRAALLGIGIVVLAGLFLSGMGEVTASAVVSAARSLVSILIYLRLFEAVGERVVHPMVAYGVGRAVYEGALVAGLGLYAAAQGQEFFETLPFNAVYFAVACVALLLLNSFSSVLRLPYLQKAAPEAETLEALGAGAAAFADQAGDPCAAVIERCRLSEREGEVLRLTCKGHTKKRIADTLGLSEDTIRYHSRNLYSKLGVHSRQELLDLVEKTSG